MDISSSGKNIPYSIFYNHFAYSFFPIAIWVQLTVLMAFRFICFLEYLFIYIIIYSNYLME